MAASEKFHVDVDELQRGLTCALIVAAAVGVLYGTLDFAVTTMRAGAVNTWNVLVSRAQRTMETLTGPLEDLIINADELGAASLFDRYPYPDPERPLVLYRKPSGVGQWRITRFSMQGSNFDVLRSIEVSLEGTSWRDEAFISEAPKRDLERVEWSPRSTDPITSTPTRAVITVVSYGGVRWRHTLTVDPPRDEMDDTQVLAGRNPRKNPTAPPSPTPASGGPSSPAGSTAPPPTPTAEVARDDGQAELAGIVDGLALIQPARRAKYVKAIKDEAFEEPQLMALLTELHRAKGDTAEIDRSIVKVLTARYMHERRQHGQIVQFHTATTPEVQEALAYQGRTKLLAEIDSVSSVDAGIHSVLGRAHMQASDPHPTATASAGEATSAGVPSVPEGQLDEAYFQKIWDQEQRWRDCMAIVDLLQKAYDVDNQDSMAQGTFDMKRLLNKGHLEYVPSCPEALTGGEYVMDPTSKRVRCTRHGNRALPWSDRRLYEHHFNDYERARILARKQNRISEAIGTLRAYLARNHGREEYNMFAQAFLGRLQFEAGNHEAAVEILKRLSDKYPKSVRLAYQTALCFYVRSNEQLALEYVTQALKPSPTEFDKTFDEESTAYELYQLRDECEWMRKNLSPTRVMPDGSVRAMPPVRYADFSIKARPPSVAKACYDSLTRFRQMVPAVAKVARGKKELVDLMQTQESQKAVLEKTPDYEKMQRNRTREALRYARVQFRDRAQKVVEEAKLSGTAFAPCPGGGVYTLSAAHGLTVDCSCHPNILPAEHIEVGKAMDARETKLVDLVLQHVMMVLSPALAACVDRQRRILETWQTDDLDIQIPAEASLEELDREGKLPKDVLHPSGETYRLVTDGEKRYLECSGHYSLQRLATLQDGVNLLVEQAK